MKPIKERIAIFEKYSNVYFKSNLKFCFKIPKFVYACAQTSFACENSQGECAKCVNHITREELIKYYRENIDSYPFEIKKIIIKGLLCQSQ